MMQENNNFDTIISSWRRMSGEQQTESVTVSMSGDSSELHKKKDEESLLLAPERLKGPIATVASAGTAATAVDIPTVPLIYPTDLEDKHDNDDSKEAAGDANANIEEDSYLENRESLANYDKKRSLSTDKVDSAYVGQTAIKVPARSTASTPEEEDCGIKCLYYTLQCCDCVLM